MISTTGRTGALGLIAAGFALIAASPASAEETAAQPESGALLPVAEAPVAGNPLSSAAHDRQFKQLFASWESLDEGKNPISGVAIPSRNPLDRGYLSSGYGMRKHPVLKRRARHKGVDIAAPTGTPIYATADGIVGRANWFSSYGLFVKIDHGAQLETRYAHMSKLAVNAGERVKKGDLIGYVGSTGRSTGPHLHYEVRIAGEAVNPMPYMNDTESERAYALAMGDGGQGGAE